MGPKSIHPKNGKFQYSTVVLFLILVIFTLSAVLCFYSGMQYESDIAAERLDAYFVKLYDTEISLLGEVEIQNFISSLPPSLNETERFEAIADWVTNNFTEAYWEHRYLDNPDFNYVEFVPSYDEYSYDPEGRVRTRFPCRYANDPAWIAYYRTGACGELAALFAEVVNRTGTPTQVVYEIDSTGWNHAWVEITRDNGELWYFDPTRYGEYNLFNEGENGAWTGKISSFTNPWGKKIVGVYDSYTHENVTDHYPLFVLE